MTETDKLIAAIFAAARCSASGAERENYFEEYNVFVKMIDNIRNNYRKKRNRKEYCDMESTWGWVCSKFKGVKCGCKLKLTEHQRREAQKRNVAGETPRSIARSHKAS